MDGTFRLANEDVRLAILWHVAQAIGLGLAFLTAPDFSQQIYTFRVVDELFTDEIMGTLFVFGGLTSLVSVWMRHNALGVLGELIQFVCLLFLLILLIFGTLEGLDGEFSYSALYISLVGPAAAARLLVISQRRKADL